MSKEVKGRSLDFSVRLILFYYYNLVDCLKLVIKSYNMFNKIQLNCNLFFNLIDNQEMKSRILVRFKKINTIFICQLQPIRKHSGM